MADATTPNYSWAYPTVNADADTWGTTLNTAIIAIDASLKTVDTATGGAAQKSANLSDLASKPTARTNLGLGTAALRDAAGAGGVATIWTGGSFVDNKLVRAVGTSGELTDTGIATNDVATLSGNFAGIGNAATARGNLGCGSIATHNVTISSSAPSGGSDGDFWYVYVP